jgi:CubicO group peptidase (beta-lactamase class C family)
MRTASRPRSARRLILPFVLGTLLVLQLSLSETALAGGTDGEHPQLAPGVAQKMSEIDRYIDGEMEATGLPGLAVAIVQGNAIIHVRGYGVADQQSRRPVTPATPFVLASSSKSFTAVSIMQLVEAGKISLDSPVVQYIPWFRMADKEASSRITVRQLYIQTSGLSGKSDSALLVKEDTSPQALENMVRSLSSVALDRAVGSSFEYSNTNYTILGLIVQIVSGQPYEQYVQQHIFSPLAMTTSYASYPEATRHGAAHGHRYWFGVPRPVDIHYHRAVTPAGYLTASAQDMAHYLVAQLNGGSYTGARVLSARGVAAMHSPEISATLMGATTGYGMAWDSREIGGVKVLIDAGDNLAFRADTILIPGGSWGVAVLQNANDFTNGARIAAISSGVVSLLAGQQPRAPGGSSPTWLALWALVGLIALQAVGIARSVVLLRRWKASPATRPHGKVAVILHAILPISVSFVWALVCLVAVPALVGYPLRLLWLIDFGQLVMITGTLALSWGIVKVVLVYSALHRGGQSPWVG